MEEGHLYLGNNIFTTLLAISEEEQTKGLQHQKWPPPVMTFLYTEAKINKFWMDKTPSPLDILFCHEGRVSQIHKGEPYSTSIIGLDKFSDLVVELPFGTVQDLGIRVGQSVGLVKPTKDELRVILANKYNKFVKF